MVSAAGEGRMAQLMGDPIGQALTPLRAEEQVKPKRLFPQGWRAPQDRAGGRWELGASLLGSWWLLERVSSAGSKERGRGKVAEALPQHLAVPPRLLRESKGRAMAMTLPTALTVFTQ